MATEHLKCDRSKSRCAVSTKFTPDFKKLVQRKECTIAQQHFLYSLHVDVITFWISWLNKIYYYCSFHLFSFTFFSCRYDKMQKYTHGSHCISIGQLSLKALKGPRCVRNLGGVERNVWQMLSK